MALNKVFKVASVYSFLDFNYSTEVFKLIFDVKSDLAEGEIIYFNKEKRSRKKNQLNIKTKLNMAYVMSDKGLLSNLSLIENVNLPAKYHNIYNRIESNNESLAKDALKETNVREEHWNKRPHEIGLSDYKKTLLARASVMSPKLILMDHPTSKLVHDDIFKLINWINLKKQQGATFIINSNDHYFTKVITDEIFNIKLGSFSNEKENILKQLKERP